MAASHGPLKPQFIGIEKSVIIKATGVKEIGVKAK
jgi:hypothetical protein